MVSVGMQASIVQMSTLLVDNESYRSFEMEESRWDLREDVVLWLDPE